MTYWSLFLSRKNVFLQFSYLYSFEYCWFSYLTTRFPSALWVEGNLSPIVNRFVSSLGENAYSFFLFFRVLVAVVLKWEASFRYWIFAFLCCGCSLIACNFGVLLWYGLLRLVFKRWETNSGLQTSGSMGATRSLMSASPLFFDFCCSGVVLPWPKR